MYVQSLVHSQLIVLILLSHIDVPDFMANNIKKHDWFNLKPEKTKSKDALEKCKAEFHLINPVPSKDWATYLTQRKKAVAAFAAELDEYAGEDLPDLHEFVQTGIWEALGNTELKDIESDVIYDSVVPLRLTGTNDGWGHVRLHIPSKFIAM